MCLTSFRTRKFVLSVFLLYLCTQTFPIAVGYGKKKLVVLYK